MTIYVLCFDPPYEVVCVSGRRQKARHYIGYTPDRDPSRRIAEHLACNGRASPLVKAAIAAGCQVHHVLTIKSGTRGFERYLKNSGHVMRWCPRCGCGRHPPKLSTWKKRNNGVNS